ncbi:hypothetical protein E2320_013927, partial [Naja naja]
MQKEGLPQPCRFAYTLPNCSTPSKQGIGVATSGQKAGLGKEEEGSAGKEKIGAGNVLRCVTPGPDDTHGALKPAAHALFKKLKDKELELLLQAVESQGAAGGEPGCLWVEARGVKPGPSASLLLCRLYRWPDLRQPHELKRLCLCKSAGGEAGGVHCCNPHHLSRLALP